MSFVATVLVLWVMTSIALAFSIGAALTMCDRLERERLIDPMWLSDNR